MNALIYVNAIAFALAIFPFHIHNYVYINTEQKYASLNVNVLGFNFFNLNTVKDDPRGMQINGKNKKIDFSSINGSYYKIFNQLCIYKIIQLGIYGIVNQNNAYTALAQSTITTALYKFIQINGNYCKLRNYTIFNEDRSEIYYYAKAVTIINLFVVTKIIFIILMEFLNEQIKKKQRKRI